jgi:hypothetical protein
MVIHIIFHLLSEYPDIPRYSHSTVRFQATCLRLFLWERCEKLNMLIHPCYVLSCHHGTVRSRVADGGDGIRIWRVAANILNK